MYKFEDQIASSESLSDQVEQKVEAKFMRAWEEREIERQKAFSEGQENGKNELLKSQVKKKLKKNYSKEEIADMLEEDVSTIEDVMSEL